MTIRQQCAILLLLFSIVLCVNGEEQSCLADSPCHAIDILTEGGGKERSWLSAKKGETAVDAALSFYGRTPVEYAAFPALIRKLEESDASIPREDDEWRARRIVLGDDATRLALRAVHSRGAPIERYFTLLCF